MMLNTNSAASAIATILNAFFIDMILPRQMTPFALTQRQIA